MEGLRDRINVIRDHYRLSNRGFAEAIGAKPAATNNYLNGTKEPSLEFVDKILSTYIDVSADRLLRGKDKQTDEALLKELAEAKVKLLVQEGITKELRDMLLEKNNGKIVEDRKSLVG